MLKTTATALCLMLGLAGAQAQDAAAPAANPSAAQPEQAGPGDTLPPPLACSFDKVFVCEAKGCAPSAELGTIDLPAKILVHFGEQIIASTADDKLPHISSIQSVIGDGESYVIDGNDNMTAWAIQLSASKPDATLMTVAGGKALSAFGTCTPAP
ncbi:hypothetical protein MWN33_01800 [Starkeya koreensis]|uniref:Uncharacterized protein n=1 Tax=Ancylobacter koreensis TaxID=266121 RepID=A0ABT0DHK1_9HYPH|nr:hypothetical protein [Ancylobacter koreensis]MCK0206759.1 hypothetical protein [Ancylobacter koreensis]